MAGASGIEHTDLKGHAMDGELDRAANVENREGGGVHFTRREARRYATPWWVELEGGDAVCVVQWSAYDAMLSANAATGKTAVGVAPLPYKASPCVFDVSPTCDPAFCMNGAACAGRTSCPRCPSCVG